LFLGVTTVTDSDAPLVVTLFGNYYTIPLAEEPKAVPEQDQTVGAVRPQSSTFNGIQRSEK